MKSAATSELTRQYAFHEGDLPSGYQFVFTVTIFNRPGYRLLHGREGWVSFYILHPPSRSVHGLVHLHVREALAVTPLRAPHGSVEISSDVSQEILNDFLEFLESRLGHAGVLAIAMKNPPNGYHLFPEFLHAVFSKRRYAISSSEITSIISVSPVAFADIIHPRKKRRLHQSRSWPLRFSRLEGSSLPDIYEFIAARRKEKGYSLSVGLDDLRRMVDQFPEEYHIFALYQGHQLVAASVAVQVHDKVLYHFISDHVRTSGPPAPALVLMEGIYNFCLSRGIDRLDLGTSAPGGVSNSGLLNFKNELGGQLADKLTYMKTLR